MKVTRLYLYPIKALRPACIERVRVNQQGFEHDRHFMLVKVEADGSLRNVQTVHFPEGQRFFQRIEDELIVVTHEPPTSSAAPEEGGLRVPLRPDTAGLQTIDITLMGSTAAAYRMPDEYGGWFSRRLGYEVILIYLGDGKRPVLAHAPGASETTASASSGATGWLASVTSYMAGSQNNKASSNENSWLTFNEAAPLLVTSEASLDDVSTRLPGTETMDMMRFRPNIVVDGTDKWDEDFWGELEIGNGTTNKNMRLALTANCGRCLSINIDYDTGRAAEGEAGSVLKKLMRDRRVDKGTRWSPIFGRYAFALGAGSKQVDAEAASGSDVVAVGDDVVVTRRLQQRDVWTWPKYD
ncbi:hypothetical protein LQW54_011997 [Pestalotiopsis sp. IQ-011]